jgi:hypothetical protein
MSVNDAPMPYDTLTVQGEGAVLVSLANEVLMSCSVSFDLGP